MTDEDTKILSKVWIDVAIACYAKRIEEDQSDTDLWMDQRAKESFLYADAFVKVLKSEYMKVKENP